MEKEKKKKKSEMEWILEFLKMSLGLDWIGLREKAGKFLEEKTVFVVVFLLREGRIKFKEKGWRREEKGKGEI